MWKFALKRFIIMIPQIFVLSIIVFLIAQMMPGDALTGLMDPDIPYELIQQRRYELGLLDPWYIRYWNWVVGVITRGDFGRSFQFQTPVVTLIGQRIGNTFRLSLFILVVMYAIALPLGIIAGRYEGTYKDKLITFYTYLGFGLPTMVVGLVFLFTFGFRLNWLPTSGSVTPGYTSDMGFTYMWSRFRHLILPGLSIALVSTVGTVQNLRALIINMKHREFVTTVRAKGADEKRLFNKHILRNSLLPIASSLGFQIAFLISGTILIEQVFGFTGMGTLFIGSITGRDFSVMIALVLLFGVAMIVGSFLSDLIMMMVDPRIEIE